MTGFIVSVFPFRNRVSSTEAFEGLELGEGKLSRPVLRGPGGRKAAWLLGKFWFTCQKARHTSGSVSTSTSSHSVARGATRGRVALCSFRRRNVHLVCDHEFGVRHLGFQSHVSAGRFLISAGKKRKFVLMVQPNGELIQERCERNWRLKSLEIRFASGLVGKPRQVVLSLIDSPEAVAKMPGA